MAALDVRELRRQIYGEGDPNRADLERLIGLGRHEARDAEFAELIADIATDVLVRDTAPPGYIANEDADWLIGALSEGGGLVCSAEFGILKALARRAICVPSQLTTFAVREIEKAVLTGRRDVTGGVDHEPGVVSSEDVAALRSVVFAATLGHPLHVDRATAEALFDIAHATATADNAPEFPDFFAQSVGNYLIGADLVAAPDREEAMQVESELARPGGFGAFFALMLAGKPDLSEIEETVSGDQETDDRALNVALASRLDAASHVDADEAKWVIAHLSRGGQLTAAERRLLAFLRNEATSAPPELTQLYAQAA